MTFLPRWWERRFLAWELATVTVLSLVFYVWVTWYGGDMLVEQNLQGRRATVYGSLASIFGSLLGFGIAAVAIVLGYAESEKLKVVRDSGHYGTLWLVFNSSIRWLGAAAAVAVLALIFDRADTARYWLMALCLWTAGVGVLRVVRTIWILENVVLLVTRQRSTNDSG